MAAAAVPAPILVADYQGNAPVVPAHVAARISKEDFTLRCPAGEAAASCQTSFPKVTAKDHNGSGLAVTERIWEMKQDATTKKWGTVQIAKDQISYAAPGTYLMTYDAVDTAGNPAEQLAFALMIDDMAKPVIQPCEGLVRSTPVEAGSKWSWCASKSDDTVDGDLSSYIKYDVSEAALGKQWSDLDINQLNQKVSSWTLGKWAVTLKSTDAAGNTATSTVQVQVVDTTAPEITVHGRNPVTDQQCKTPYGDDGASAEDIFDTHWKNAVKVSSSVAGPAANASPSFSTLSQHTGDYTVTYTATDLQGNTAGAMKRPVRVVDTKAPTLSLNGFPATETHYAGASFSKPTVTCADSCDGAPKLTETWVAGYGIPSTYDPDLPAYAAKLPAAGCSHRCGNSQACGTGCISKKYTCRKDAAKDAWSACDADVFDKIMESPGVKKANHGTHFALALGADGNDKTHGAKYVKEYTCTDYTGLKSVQRVTYTVEDNTKPVLNMAAPARQEIEATASGSWSDPGATCQDYSDGNIVPKVVYGATGKPNKQVDGTYTVTYKCTDSAGNSAPDQTRVVVVKDENCPVITLKGETIQVVEAGFPWTEPGFTVADDVTPSADMKVTTDGDTVDVKTAFTSFRSCAEIKGAYPAAQNGPYVVTAKRAGGKLENTQVICDMTSAQTYLAVKGDRIKPYGSDGGKCAANGFVMPKANSISAFAKKHFGGAYFPAVRETTDEYLCSLDGLTLTHNVHTVDTNTIKYAKKGVYKITYHTKDGAGNEECTPRGMVTRTVVVKDTLAPVIVIRRPGSDKYAVGSIGDAQKAKLATLPYGDDHRDGIPSANEVTTFLRGSVAPVVNKKK